MSGQPPQARGWGAGEQDSDSVLTRPIGDPTLLGCVSGTSGLGVVANFLVKLVMCPVPRRDLDPQHQSQDPARKGSWMGAPASLIPQVNSHSTKARESSPRTTRNCLHISRGYYPFPHLVAPTPLSGKLPGQGRAEIDRFLPTKGSLLTLHHERTSLPQLGLSASSESPGSRCQTGL